MPPSLADSSFPWEILIEYMNWVDINKAVLPTAIFTDFITSMLHILQIGGPIGSSHVPTLIPCLLIV